VRSNQKEIEIAQAIGNCLQKKYDWNVFGAVKCNKCKTKKYLSGKFCSQCGQELECVLDESVCQELYEAYMKGKKIDENCS
jgi:hypothetical protein